jgi:ATP-dependent helicase/nuclease subunit B
LNAERIVRVEYGDDALQVLADLLLDQASAELPDLSRRVVLLAQPGAIARFQCLLLDSSARRAIPALIPPEIDTLRVWLRRFAPPCAILSEAERELMLLEALGEYPALSARTGTWPLIHSVLELFDELNLNAGQFPDDLTTLTYRLAKAYGIDDAAFAPLTNEAQLVYRLWHAWREQLTELDVLDASQALTGSLEQSLARLDRAKHIYLVGHVNLSKAERAWAKALLLRGQLSLIVQGQTGARGYHPDSPLTELLSELGAPLAQPAARDGYAQALDLALSAGDIDLPTRIRTQTALYPNSPLQDRLHLYEAEHAEDEACAIDLQVRRWWLEGRRDIGIVTNDRKLARRVRALLERAHIALHDSAGWPLSTTSAASVLERWLETIEQGFAHQPLLDLLRSPFVRFTDHERQRETAARFEHGVVQRFAIPGGLRRYQDVAQKQHARLDDYCGAGSADAILDLLAALAGAAAPLQRLLNGAARPVHHYLTALFKSLDALGLTASYQRDPAGLQLLDALAEMRVAAVTRSSLLNWSGFRGWLRRNLERGHFRLPAQAQGVVLMDFASSRLCRFDAVIIAGAHREQLPGAVSSPAFFNDAVRRELGLPGSVGVRNELFYDFRRLLEAAPRVLITLRREQHGEPVVASPWVERLRAFHQLAYGTTLAAPELAALRVALKPICRAETGALPIARDYPRVAAPDLIPPALSASSYQCLLDCPYQFYARYALALRPFEDIEDDIDKADYGSRVHRILRAFHGGAPGLPGPFDVPLNAASLPQAQALMQAVTDAVFAADERHSFGARAWRYRWQQVIPHYLDWQLERARRWQVHACEQSLQRAIDKAPELSLTGQIDRVDHDGNEYAIIDYKTGELPKIAEITAGEKIQLPFYALLADVPVEQVLFLRLDDASADANLCLEGPALADLSAQQHDRLVKVYRKLRAGAPLPAWGDRVTCERCEMAGLCRKEYWNENGL